MRHVRLSLGVVATVCTFAVAAAPAMAHEFLSNAVGKPTKGVSVGPQEFKFGAFKIVCPGPVAVGNGYTGPGATTKGRIAASPSNTFFTEATYKRCEAEARLNTETFWIKVKVPKIDYEYHANGFVENGVESEENVTLSGGTVEMKAHQPLNCIINWEAQTIPVRAKKNPEGEFTEAAFTNEEVANGNLKKFPSGFQKKMSIANTFGSMDYEVEEGQCENFEHVEGKSGKYTGTLLEEVPSGNLEFQ